MTAPASGPRSERFYGFVVAFALWLMRLLRWTVAVEGEENVPRSGPAILAANHVSFLDFIFIGYGANLRGRLVRFLSRHEAFSHPVSGPLMRAMRHIPVNRDVDPARAFRHAIEAIDEGAVVGLHPEGKMQEAFRPRGLKTGAARLAIDTGAPLIPVALLGGEKIWSRGRRKLLQRRARIDVVFGTPILPRPDETPSALSDRLGEAIAQLLAGIRARV